MDARESEWHHAEIGKSIGDAGAFNVKLIFWHVLIAQRTSVCKCVNERTGTERGASTGEEINFPRAAIFDVQRGKRDYSSARLDLRCVTAALKIFKCPQNAPFDSIGPIGSHLSAFESGARGALILNSTAGQCSDRRKRAIGRKRVKSTKG